MSQPAHTQGSYLELLGANVVDVYVGTTRRHYRLHEDLLCKHSPFFRAAFQGGFKESRESHLELPTDNADGFDFLVKWLYTKKISQQVGTPWVLFELYLQSQKFQIAELQREAMKVMHKYFNTIQKRPTCGLMRRVFRNTDESDPLRRYLTDVVAYLIRTRKAKSIDYKRLLEARSPFAVELGSATEKLNALRRPRDPRALRRQNDYVACCRSRLKEEEEAA